MGYVVLLLMPTKLISRLYVNENTTMKPLYVC